MALVLSSFLVGQVCRHRIPIASLAYGHSLLALVAYLIALVVHSALVALPPYPTVLVAAGLLGLVGLVA